MAKRRGAHNEDNDAQRFFQAHGFVLVPSFLTPEELHALQQESAALYAHVQAVSADASKRIVEQVNGFPNCFNAVALRCWCRVDIDSTMLTPGLRSGCHGGLSGASALRVLNIPHAEKTLSRWCQQIPEASRTRVDRALYLSSRAAQFASVSGKATPEVASVELNVISRLLFERLPSFAADLLASSFPDITAATRPGILFFNEHYVVKPPQTAVGFRWHRDDDEQLGMCLHRVNIPPYVSAWCALDDITSENGALRFVPISLQDTLEGGSHAVPHDEATLNAAASAPLLAQAGSVVFFLSNVWHCSSCNDSDRARRAFYAQYSRSKITAMPNDPAPLSFAIPCGVSNSDGRSKRARKFN